MNSKLNQIYTEQEILAIHQQFLNQKLFAVYKPPFWTTQDVVGFLKNFLQVKKIGHGGELDSSTSGLLVVGINERVKDLSNVLFEDKTFLATIKFNERCSKNNANNKEMIETRKILITKKDLMGAINFYDKLEYYQSPHKFSAVKVKGHKIYEYDRDGENIQIQAKKVQIKQLNLISLEKDIAVINLTVSKGFCVNVFAEELAEKINTIAHLQKLVCINFIQFELNDQTVNIQKLKKSFKQIKKIN